MKRALWVMALIFLVTACSSLEPPETDTDCRSADTEETDGGVGGTGREPCEDDESGS